MACWCSSNSAVFGISLNFESCDEEDIISSREDLMGRLRFRSNPVQDNCSHLRGGEKVLVMKIVQSKCFCFDAVIEKVFASCERIAFYEAHVLMASILS